VREDTDDSYHGSNPGMHAAGDIAAAGIDLDDDAAGPVIIPEE
jgi:hypothetical protein